MPPHPLAAPKKPQGQITRGKTARNRLRRVDHFLAMYDAALITRADGEYADALFVDLGYGAEAITTLESAERLRKLNPALPILGVEIDPERVANALPYADANTSFRLGGFNVPIIGSERVKIIRAFNVLRQYDEAEFDSAYDQMLRCLLVGGLLIEGTSNPFGSIWSANVARKTESGWSMEALVFSTNFRSGFDPSEFQTILPKNYIHHVVPNEPIYNFFEAWKSAVNETQAIKAYGLRQWFAESAIALARRGYAIDLRKKWITKGWLIWKV
jgi:hypothetical protein